MRSLARLVIGFCRTSPVFLAPARVLPTRLPAAAFFATKLAMDVHPEDPVVIFPIEEVTAFICKCMETVGTTKQHAKQLADVLVMADCRGHFSHGLNRLEMYMRDMKNGTCSIKGEPSIIKESSSTALIDGHNLLGPVVGRFAMDLAIKKAKENGVGWVAARASNHYGIAGYYGLLACNVGLIGMSFTNTSPLSVPTRGKTRALGTNPICFAAPGVNGDAFILDLATTTVAIGKVELAMRKEEEIPYTWGVNSHGKPTSNPAEVYNGGGLMQIGGAEETGGYKGYALNMMVEILCGIMADAAFGPLIRSWSIPDREANLGQAYVAIDPSRFGEGFTDRLQMFMNMMRNLDPADPSRPVLVPGDPERAHIAKCKQLGGIPYHKNEARFAEDLAQRLGLTPMKHL